MILPIEMADSDRVVGRGGGGTTPVVGRSRRRVTFGVRGPSKKNLQKFSEPRELFLPISRMPAVAYTSCTLQSNSWHSWLAGRAWRCSGAAGEGVESVTRSLLKFEISA